MKVTIPGQGRDQANQLTQSVNPIRKDSLRGIEWFGETQVSRPKYRELKNQELKYQETNNRERYMNRFLLAGATAALVLAATSASFAADKKTLAFVVNGASDFWKAAEAGVKKAQGELPNYNLVFKYPEQASAAIQI
ncbi:MAG TPA: hypothetical protein VII39_15630, partial [Bradyrhizobium sp.]